MIFNRLKCILIFINQLNFQFNNVIIFVIKLVLNLFCNPIFMYFISPDNITRINYIPSIHIQHSVYIMCMVYRIVSFETSNVCCRHTLTDINCDPFADFSYIKQTLYQRTVMSAGFTATNPKIVR